MPSRAKIAAERIAGALREFTSFEQWIDEYNSYLARTEMAPFSSSFYLYDRTLHRPYPEGELSVPNDIGEAKISGGEKFGFRLRRFLFAHADRQRAGSGRLFKKLLAGCRSCANCRLPLTEYVCTENCPKRLSNGPCGGVRPRGECELGGGECIHSRIVRMAHWNRTLQKLEDTFPGAGRG